MRTVEKQGIVAEADATPTNFFSYRGRAGRGQYWIGLAIGMLVLFAAVASLASGMRPTGGGAPFLAVPFLMLFFWIHSLVAIKRLRDMGLSGWYYFVFGVGPFVVLALMLVFIGTIGPIIALVFFGALALPGLIQGKPAEVTDLRS